MKKKLFKLTLSAFAMLTLVFSFSSCLGDSDTTYERTNEFVYIDQASSVGLYSISADLIYATSDAIKALSQGDCAIINYKFNTSQTSNGVFLAENTQVVERFPSASQPSISPVSPPTMENRVYPSSLKIYRQFVGQEYMGNRWPFVISYTEEGSSGFRPYFYYDASNQFETNTSGDEVELGANQVIIDVRFTKENPGTGTSTQAKEEKFVANLSNLKLYYTTSNGLDYSASGGGTDGAGNRYVPVTIKFRYQTEPGKDAYLGSTWSVSSGAFYMVFIED